MNANMYPTCIVAECQILYKEKALSMLAPSLLPLLKVLFLATLVALDPTPVRHSSKLVVVSNKDSLEACEFVSLAFCYFSLGNINMMMISSLNIY